MKRKIKKLLCCTLMICMTLALFSPAQVQAAGKLNITNKTLKVGQTLVLKVTGATGSVKWSSSKSSVATVNQSGKVTAKKAGKATIKAKVAGKILKCKIKVKKLNYKTGIVYKDDNVIVKFTGLSNGSNLGGYDINFQIENISDVSLTIQNRETSINGFMVNLAALSVDVSPGKKANASIMVFGDDAEEIPISKINEIETKLAIVDSEDFNTYYETEVFTIM